MAVNRLESARNAPQEGAASEAKNGAAEGEAPVKRGRGALGAWLPLIANLVLMPALGYATFTWLVLPKMKPPGEQQGAPAEAGKESVEAGGKQTAPAKVKVTAPLPGKVLVNVAGTMGTRYLLANMTLVSHNTELKGLIEKNEPQLKDAAASALASKTIPDLEKPGARNVIRNELISIFNNVLGEGTVIELYLTEFAIQ
ncbi:MAG: flagellar basal body-associated FliL family protein [Verrucomicrobiota bacterium]